jgi:hypothetical protein
MTVTPSTPAAALQSADDAFAEHRADPAEVVALHIAEQRPGTSRDVLAGWGWSTGTMPIVEDGDHFEAAARASRKRLAIILGCAVAAAVVVAGVFVFTGSSDEQDPQATVPALAAPQPSATARPSATAPPTPAVAAPAAPAPPAPPAPPAAPPVESPATASAAPVPAGEPAAVPAAQPTATGSQTGAAAPPEPAPPAVVAEPPRPPATAAPKVAAPEPRPASEPPRAVVAAPRAAASEPSRAPAAKPVAPPVKRAEIRKAAEPKPPARRPAPAKPTKQAFRNQPADPYEATPEQPRMDPAVTYRLGLQQYARGDTTSALATFRNTLSTSPGYAPAWRGLGLVYEKLGDRGQARGAFRRYLQLAPTAGDADQVRDRLERLGP